jgi:hypothetical protein
LRLAFRFPGAAILLSAVPFVGIVELGLHIHQVSDVVPERDWASARDAVAKELGPDDLVTFAPYWADPLGRRTFGDTIMTFERAARSDEARFARAWEVSIRGFHDPTLAKWRKVSEQHHGAVTVALFENPAPEKVIDDLIDFVGPGKMTVSRVEAGAETPCTFQHGATAGGSTVVPQGLLVPADKFVCGGGHVGVAVLHALDHHPHVCIEATPLQNATLKLVFKGVTFGASLTGHSGVQWVSERVPSQERTTVAFSAFDRPIATHTHKLGAGWVGFELPTEDLAGKKGDLVAEIGGSQQRYFCFEASTRNRSAP